MIEKTYSFDHGGKTIDVYTLKNSSGMEMDVCTYGGRILRLTAPDRNGRMGDVIMGFKRPEDYVKNHAYYGAFIGRYGNRIGGACFTLNGVTYKLYPNNGRNTLHGGKEGFDVKVMSAEVRDGKLVLGYLSPDGEEGYPGNLDIKVSYSLTDDNEAVLEYYAVTDKDTLCNLTNHAYFNIGERATISLTRCWKLNLRALRPLTTSLFRITNLWISTELRFPLRAESSWVKTCFPTNT